MLKCEIEIRNHSLKPQNVEETLLTAYQTQGELNISRLTGNGFVGYPHKYRQRLYR